MNRRELIGLNHFATIKKPTQADDAAHAGLVLPLTAKSQLHDKHDQRDEDSYRILIELKREEKRTSHRSTFPAPSVSALGAYCVERSRTRKEFSRTLFCNKRHPSDRGNSSVNEQTLWQPDEQNEDGFKRPSIE